MAHLSAAQMVNYWVNAGGTGDPAKLIWALCVSRAESGWDTEAVSPSHDYGIYQINSVHFGDGIINANNWYQPLTNSREAVRLSHDGTNWAAWCTAWANPAGNCGHGFLARPQKGSPAYNEYDVVVTLWRGGHVQIPDPTHPTSKPAPAPHVGNAKVSQAWDDMNHYIHTTAPAQWAKLNSIQQAIRKVAG